MRLSPLYVSGWRKGQDGPVAYAFSALRVFVLVPESTRFLFTSGYMCRGTDRDSLQLCPLPSSMRTACPRIKRDACARSHQDGYYPSSSRASRCSVLISLSSVKRRNVGTRHRKAGGYYGFALKAFRRCRFHNFLLGCFRVLFTGMSGRQLTPNP